MPHRRRSPLARAPPPPLVPPPESAVEQQAVAVGGRRDKIFVDSFYRRNVKDRRPRAHVENFICDNRPVVTVRRRRRLDVSRNLAGDEKRLEAKTASDGFAFAIFNQSHAKSLRLIQGGKNRIRPEHPIENPRRAI